MLAVLLVGVSSCTAPKTPTPPPDVLADVPVRARSEWAALLDSAGYHPDSIAVLFFVPHENQLHIYNPSEAARALPPGATANLPLALIGLHRGLIAGDTLTVNPESNPYPSAQKVALASVLQAPSVEFFSGLVHRMGAQVAADELVRIGFTQAPFTPASERFWQDGSLTVSLYDQVRFTYSLLHPGGAVEPMAAKTVLRASKEANDGPFRYGGKTGWPVSDPHNVGWWVGWAMRGDRYAIVAIRVWTQRKVRSGWTDQLRATGLLLLQQEGWWPSPKTNQ